MLTNPEKGNIFFLRSYVGFLFVSWLPRKYQNITREVSAGRPNDIRIIETEFKKSDSR